MLLRGGPRLVRRQIQDLPAVLSTQCADLDVEDFDVIVRIASIESALAVWARRELGIVKRWPVLVTDRMASRQCDLDAEHGVLVTA